VVADAARAAGLVPCAFVDRKPPADTVDELPVFATLEEACREHADANARSTFIAAIGDNEQRAEEYVHAFDFGLEPATIMHPTAVVSETAQVGVGAYLGAQAVVNPGARIGENAIINTAAVIEHDCHVGAHAFVAPGAVLCGAAGIGDFSFVGAGATLIPLVQVGAHALVAAGAVVVRDYPEDGARLFGVPAQNRDQAQEQA